ncbi:MAG TPA: hypothetical protein VFS19_03010 [Planctomycetota bacterium]|nr:hypothetical protein [Planctomycetota bacterium]
MNLLLILMLLSPQEDPSLTDMPEGWVSGKKSGWDGDYPPGWPEKTDEEKKKFLTQWNNAKFRYINFMKGAKGTPTGGVTAILFMLKAVNAGLGINQAADLTMFGQNSKLKEADFKIMLKAASSVFGTEVPHGEAVNITKDIVTTGLRGSALDQRVRAEITKKNQQLLEAKARKEKEAKENEGKKEEGDKKDGDKKDGGGKKE